MRNLIYSVCVLFLYFKTIWGKAQDGQKWTFHISDNQIHTLTPPNYPSCCTPAEYLLVSDSHTESDPSNWRLLFTDLDIPPGSELLIYGYKSTLHEEGVPLHSPKYSPEGTWLRPAIIFQGYALGLVFHPIQSESKSYLGFNATYWLTQETDWTHDRPFTVCPPVGDIMEGGVVEVTKFLQPVRIHHYRYFCIWQLKPPPSNDMRMYIDVYAVEDSNIKIRQGTHSGKPLLLEVKPSDRLKIPTRLTSDHGFYIELDKPTNSGNFTMVYGAYKQVDSDEECKYHIDNEELQGFRCKEKVPSWCIPMENKCNGIPDCPQNEDEEEALCSATPPTTPAPTSSPCFWHQCEDGRCRNYMERCPEESCPAIQPARCEGTLTCVNPTLQSCPGKYSCPFLHEYCEVLKKCITKFSKCEKESPEEICKKQSWRKYCRDGRCIRSSARCPEDPCPSYKPHKCGGSCYYESEVCNGVAVCYDKSDEQNCYKKKKAPWLSTLSPHAQGLIGASLVVATVGSILLVLWCTYRKVRHAQTNEEVQINVLDDQNRLMPYTGSCINQENNQNTQILELMDLPPSYNEAMAENGTADRPKAAEELPPRPSVVPPPYEEAASQDLSHV